MKIKTSNLTGAALDWAVAKCEKLNPVLEYTTCTRRIYIVAYVICALTGDIEGEEDYSPSTNWAQGGSILTNARISRTIDHSGQWIAYWTDGYTEGDEGKLHMQCDRSELVAGLRCYVAMKLGDEVEIPDELAN